LGERHKTDLHLARNTNNDGSGSRNVINTFFRKGTENENRFTSGMSSSGRTQGVALGNTANGRSRPAGKEMVCGEVFGNICKREIIRSVVVFRNAKEYHRILQVMQVSIRLKKSGNVIICTRYEGRECGHIHILHDCSKHRGQCRCSFMQTSDLFTMLKERFGQETSSMETCYGSSFISTRMCGKSHTFSSKGEEQE
jgi:hypothetical protein